MSEDMSTNINKEETKTPRTKEELQEDVNKFNVEFKELLSKYRLTLLAQPVITPDGRIVARPNVIDAEVLKPTVDDSSKPGTANVGGPKITEG